MQPLSRPTFRVSAAAHRAATGPSGLAFGRRAQRRPPCSPSAGRPFACRPRRIARRRALRAWPSAAALSDGLHAAPQQADLSRVGRGASRGDGPFGPGLRPPRSATASMQPLSRPTFRVSAAAHRAATGPSGLAFGRRAQRRPPCSPSAGRPFACRPRRIARRRALRAWPSAAALSALAPRSASCRCRTSASAPDCRHRRDTPRRWRVP